MRRIGGHRDHRQGEDPSAESLEQAPPIDEQRDVRRAGSPGDGVELLRQGFGGNPGETEPGKRHEERAPEADRCGIAAHAPTDRPPGQLDEGLPAPEEDGVDQQRPDRGQGAEGHGVPGAEDALAGRRAAGRRRARELPQHEGGHPEAAEKERHEVERSLDEEEIRKQPYRGSRRGEDRQQGGVGPRGSGACTGRRNAHHRVTVFDLHPHPNTANPAPAAGTSRRRRHRRHHRNVGPR